MLQPGGPGMLGFGAFSIFAALGGLVLLVGADHAAPGCTGPEVKRCDYIATAKAAVAGHPHRRFYPDFGFEVIDMGSSVRVQQYLPDNAPGLFEGPAVLIDRKSCRPCNVEVRTSIKTDDTVRVVRFPPSRKPSGASAPQDVVVTRVGA
jgi:hypothetical protein